MMTLMMMEQVNAELHDELRRERERGRSAKEQAGAGSDAEDVVRELRHVVGELEGQLKQQVVA